MILYNNIKIMLNKYKYELFLSFYVRVFLSKFCYLLPIYDGSASFATTA